MSKVHKTPEKKMHCFDISNKKIEKLLKSDFKRKGEKEDLKKEINFTRILRKALKEEKKKNSELNKKIIELESVLAAAHDSLEEKDEAILELFSIINSLKLKLDHIIIKNEDKKT